MKFDLTIPMYWNTYFMKKNTFASKFWKKYLTSSSDKKILFILGRGFDSRMLNGVTMMNSISHSNTLNYLLINFDEGDTSFSNNYSELITKNNSKFETLVPKNNRKSISIDMWSDDDRPIGAKESSEIIQSDDISQYDDIVVDISALPITIHFPLIGKLLSLYDKHHYNLHVIVSENSMLDHNIIDVDLDESASYMPKFTGGLGNTSMETLPKIWIPIMEEKKSSQMAQIHDLISPDEIHPLFPMPSKNPRKFETLLEEYGVWLYDTLRIDSRNFVFAAEQNPFEVYREIRKIVTHYSQTFGEKKCQIIISPLSNKLSSLGSLLSAYELKKLGVGIAHVENRGYRIEDVNLMSKTDQSELFTLWLSGECYEE